MASEAALKKKIRDLSDEIESLSSEAASERRRIEEENRDNLKRLKEAQARALEENKRRMDAAYLEVVHKLRDELQREMLRYAEELRRADEKARERVRAKLEELSRAEEELAREVQKLREEDHRRSETGKAIAREKKAEAEGRAAEVGALPHEFFLPHQLELFQAHVETADAWIKKGLYEAASAVADAAIMELQIIKLRILDMQNQWEACFSRFAALAQSLHSQLESFEKTPVPVAGGMIELTERLREHFSGGEYGRLKAKIEKNIALVRAVDEAGGITAYLSSGDAPKQDLIILEILPEIKKLTDHFSAVAECIENEVFFSSLRRALADYAAEQLGSMGYTILDSGFRDSDPLETFDVVASANGADTVRVSLVPRRHDGVTNGVLCLVSVGNRTTPEPGFLQKTAMAVVDSLYAAYAEHKVPIEACLDTCSADALEKSRKQPPDVRRFERKRERKQG